MAARKKHRGLIYIRRSTSRQELSLPAQLEWALKEAAKLGVVVDASLADLQFMQEKGLVSYKSIRLDDGRTGADMERPGFMALQKDAVADKSISHIFIHKRDRLARPQEVTDMIQIEKKLRYAGITIWLSGKVGEPLDVGQANPVVDMELYFEYYESGEYLRKLSERVVTAQKTLAEGGFRTGGKPPYGFGRILVDSSGKTLQDLPPGRRVRQPGCHVRIVVTDPEKIKNWVMILDLRKQGWGIKRIAAHLNKLGIPSPDVGCVRKDHGIAHYVSGRWSPGTVAELCRNSAIISVQQFGRRLEGEHRRHGADGFRLLQESDRNALGKAKMVNNDPARYIVRPIGIKEQYDPLEWERLQAEIHRRGTLQRGIPRTRNPARFPLACRVIDLTDNCGSVMYGRIHGKRLIYVCGQYNRTAGAECAANAVDSEALLRFSLETIRQVIGLNGEDRQELKRLLMEQAQKEQVEPDRSLEIKRDFLQRDITQTKENLAVAQRRMTIEKDDARYQALAEEFDRIRKYLLDQEQQLHTLEQKAPTLVVDYDPDKEVAAAMSLLGEVDRITGDRDARAEINALLTRLGIRIGLNFAAAIKGKERVVRKLVNGIMVFGNNDLPVPIHGKDRVEPADGNGHDGKSANHGENGKGGEQGKNAVSENAAAGTGSEPIPAVSGVHFCERRPREGISSTKDGRGGGT